MSKNVLNTSVKLINEKVKFECLTEGKPPIIVDYIPPIGDGEGYTSLELLLISFSTCVASTLKILLNARYKAEVKELKVSSTGIRREEHPTCFEVIKIEMSINCPGVSREDIDKILTLAEDTYAPVWAMIKNNSKIEVNFQLIK